MHNPDYTDSLKATLRQVRFVQKYVALKKLNNNQINKNDKYQKKSIKKIYKRNSKRSYLNKINCRKAKKKLNFSIKILKKFISNKTLLPEDKTRFYLALDQSYVEIYGINHRNRFHKKEVERIYKLAKSFT